MDFKKIESIYTNPESAGSYGGVDRLYREAKKLKLKKVTKASVRKWLAGRLSYTLHKPALRKIKRGRTIVFYIDELWQMDLCEMQTIKEYNGGVRYLLTVIDVFSKYSWVEPLKDKKSKTTLEAFLKILNNGEREPKNLQSDFGSEFYSREFQGEMKRREINFYTTHSENKASVVERFNRTLKNRIWRYFTENNTFKYIDVLQEIVTSYNTTPHTGIGKRTPESVGQHNQLKIWRERFFQSKTSFTYKIGDQVRISLNKGVFKKGYTSNWTEEYFLISKRLNRSPVVYKLKDLHGDSIDGIFYQEELQRVTVSEDYKYPVSKVLKKQKRKALVKWRGWPDSFNSWVPLGDLTKYGGRL
jgi:transposase InsO family protein